MNKLTTIRLGALCQLNNKYNTTYYKGYIGNWSSY